MVLKRLPKKIVRRLRKAYSKQEAKQTKSEETIPMNAEKFFNRLPSADHRNPTEHDHRRFNDVFGFRVRELNVKGTNGVILKKMHSENPLFVLTTLRQIVDRHNKRFTNEPYILRKPKGHPIGEHFIAMSKINAPSIGEMLPGKYTTKRGEEFLKTLAKQKNVSPTELVRTLETAHQKLFQNCETVRQQMPLHYGSFEFLRTNVIVIGIEKGKFVFVPLLDVF